MGGGELLVVAFVALLFIPPKKLPEVANTLGRLFVKLQSQFSEIKKEMTMNMKDDLGIGKKILEDPKPKDPQKPA